MALFKSFGSRQSLRDPFVFLTTKRLLTQSVHWSILHNTPDLTLVSRVHSAISSRNVGPGVLSVLQVYSLLLW